jgi:sec-independent protein translocase protein TatC
MEGQVNVFIWVCLLAGFILSFPYILGNMEIYKSCTLQEWKEKCQGIHIFFSSLLFIGVLFGYYIVIPMSVNFVATFKVSDLVLNQFTLDSILGW